MQLCMPSHEIAFCMPAGAKGVPVHAHERDHELDVERLQKLVLHNPVTLNLLGSGRTVGHSAGGEAGPGLGLAPEIEHFAVRHRQVLQPFRTALHMPV